MKIKSENTWWAFAFLLVGLAYFFGLFIDLTGDSGLYAAITRQMVESGDWFNLKINDVPYDQKPHLFFWLAGIGVELFGNTNFAFKLFPFLYGLAGIYFTYRLGKQLFSAEAGKLAALIAGTSQMFFLYFFDYHTDTVLQTGVVLALWQLAAYLQQKKRVNFIVGFVGVGLAMLTKGPIGAVIPFLGVLLYLLIKKDFKQIFHTKWLLGIVIVLIIISPSLVQLYQNFGINGIKFYFITNNVGRITGEVAGSSTEYIFYIHTLLWAFLPWTIFVVIAIYSEIKNWFQHKNESLWGFYLLGSVLILLVVFSISRGKAPNYFLIMVSPLAVISANRIFAFASKQKALKRLLDFQVMFVGLIAIAFLFILSYTGFISRWLAVGFSSISVILILALIRSRKLNLQITLLLSVIVIAGFNLFFNAKVYPTLYAYQGAKQALEIYENERGENDVLLMLKLEEYEIFYMANAPVQGFAGWEEFYAFLKNDRAWIYTTEEGYQVVKQLAKEVKEVYEIPQQGMNHLTLEFLNSKTRENSLKSNYLIVTSNRSNKGN